MFDLTPDQLVFLSLFSYWLGATARVLWPYALKRVQTGEPFNLRYIGGQALTTGGLFILLLANTGTVEIFGSLGIVGGLLGGFAAASIGRNGQKTVDVARGK